MKTSLAETIGCILLSMSLLAHGTNKQKTNTIMVNKTPTEETRNLYNYIRQIPSKGFMFGHQDATLYGIGWKGDEDRSDVKSVCGDYPAVYGWEVGHIELGSPESLDAINFDQMRKHILNAYERGGINTISWHMDNPLTGGTTWDVSQKGVVKAILPGGARHELYLTWLERLAAFLTSLKTPGGTAIPILFRPFHEHSGSWFWWGSELCTPEEYKQIWRFTIDFLKKKKLNNLIYVYSPDFSPSSDDYLERYPGDDYVDILGFDFYHRNGDTGTDEFVRSTRTVLDYMTTLSETKDKPMVISETGSEGIPMANWWTEVLFKTISEYPIAYVMVWRNAYSIKNHYYAPYPGQASEADFIRFYNEPRTLFLKEIKNKSK